MVWIDALMLCSFLAGAKNWVVVAVHEEREWLGKESDEVAMVAELVGCVLDS